MRHQLTILRFFFPFVSSSFFFFVSFESTINTQGGLGGSNFIDLNCSLFVISYLLDVVFLLLENLLVKSLRGFYSLVLFSPQFRKLSIPLSFIAHTLKLLLQFEI